MQQRATILEGGVMFINNTDASIFQGKYFDYLNLRHCNLDLVITKIDKKMNLSIDTKSCFPKGFNASFDLL